MEPWLVVGAGRVGLQLAQHIYRQGVPLAGVVCRSPESQGNALRVLPESLIFSTTAATPAASRVLLTVRDREVRPTAKRIVSKLKAPAVILHCSGALGPGALESFAGSSFATGVFHPLLPFPHPVNPPAVLTGAVVTIAGDPRAVTAGEELAHALGMLAVPVAQLTWPLYHAAAVLAGPLLYALVQAAQEELQRAGFPSDKIPAAVATLARATLTHATSAQGWGLLTGPAVRQDWGTARAHQKVLQAETQKIYQALTTYTRSRLQASEHAAAGEWVREEEGGPQA